MTTTEHAAPTDSIARGRTGRSASGCDFPAAPTASLPRNHRPRARNAHATKQSTGSQSFYDITVDDFIVDEEPGYGESLSPSSPATTSSKSASISEPCRPSSAPPTSQGALSRACNSPPASDHASNGTVSPTLSFSLTDSPEPLKLLSPSNYSRSFSLDVSAAATGSNTANIPTPRLGIRPCSYSIEKPTLKSSSCEVDKQLGNKLKAATMGEGAGTSTTEAFANQASANGSFQCRQSGAIAEPATSAPHLASRNSRVSSPGSWPGDRATLPETGTWIGKKVIDEIGEPPCAYSNLSGASNISHGRKARKFRVPIAHTRNTPLCTPPTKCSTHPHSAQSAHIASSPPPLPSPLSQENTLRMLSSTFPKAPDFLSLRTPQNAPKLISPRSRSRCSSVIAASLGGRTPHLTQSVLSSRPHELLCSSSQVPESFTGSLPQRMHVPTVHAPQKRPGSPIPPYSPCTVAEPPQRRNQVLLGPAIDKMVARGGHRAAHDTARARASLKMPTPATPMTAFAGACSGVCGSAGSVGSLGHAAAEIARLERLLCTAHDAKRDSDRRAEELRASVESLRQQVADLSTAVRVYRCSSFMPSGYVRASPMGAASGKLLELEDGSTGRRDEERSESRVTAVMTAVHGDTPVLGSTRRGLRRSVHCLSRAPRGVSYK